VVVVLAVCEGGVVVVVTAAVCVRGKMGAWMVVVTTIATVCERGKVSACRLR
jgi:hypothetical protein